MRQRLCIASGFPGGSANGRVGARMEGWRRERGLFRPGLPLPACLGLALFSLFMSDIPAWPKHLESLLSLLLAMNVLSKIQRPASF